MLKKFLVTAALFVICVVNSWAGQVPNDYSIKTWWSPGVQIKYPHVRENRSIEFRLTAPAASKVELYFGEWDVKPIQMKKDKTGMWVATISPVESETYCYYYSVDGLITIDVDNPSVKTGTKLYGNTVEVPGSPSRFDEVRKMAHGRLEVLQYQSSSLHKRRNLYVYVPKAYFDNDFTRFPVLYLRHGGGDSEASWTIDGHADTIEDNLVAEGKAVPAIIVMTNGMTDGTWAGGSTPEAMIQLQQELVDDVIPLVDSSFRTRAERGSRAIAGLSMGGGQAFVMGLKNLDKFAWVGEFSAGLLSAADTKVDELVPGVLNVGLNNRLSLLWLGCGNIDPRFPGYLNLCDTLRSRGIKITSKETDGGHEWKVWRHQLHDFMELEFTHAPSN